MRIRDVNLENTDDLIDLCIPPDKKDDPLFLYHPLKEGYIHDSKEKKFIPQKEDKGKALIFYDPSCPFCIYFSEKIKESLREVAPDIPIRTIDTFWELEEVKRRGKVPPVLLTENQLKHSLWRKRIFREGS